MLAIARRSPIFSLTNNGRTKSWAVRLVSRTRLRRAGERRNRRGRWTNFLTKRGYAFRDRVASSPRDKSVRLVDLTGRGVPCTGCLVCPFSGDDSRDKLLADRHQQFVYKARFRFDSAGRALNPDSNQQIRQRVSSPVREATQD